MGVICIKFRLIATSEGGRYAGGRGTQDLSRSCNDLLLKQEVSYMGILYIIIYIWGFK